MKQIAWALVVASLLAGCAQAPEVPDDAVLATADGLPGITLSAWVEQRGDRVYLRAVAQNQGPDLETKEDCGYLWQSTLMFNGTPVEYQEPSDHICDWWHHTLRAGDYREFLHSWGRKTWDGEETDAQSGNWSWTVRFLARDGADHDTMQLRPGRYVEATVPFQLP